VFGLEDILPPALISKAATGCQRRAYRRERIWRFGNGQAADEIKGGVDFDLVGQRPCGMELEFVRGYRRRIL